MEEQLLKISNKELGMMKAAITKEKNKLQSENETQDIEERISFLDNAYNILNFLSHIGYYSWTNRTSKETLEKKKGELDELINIVQEFTSKFDEKNKRYLDSVLSHRFGNIIFNEENLKAINNVIESLQEEFNQRISQGTVNRDGITSSIGNILNEIENSADFTIQSQRSDVHIDGIINGNVSISNVQTQNNKSNSNISSMQIFARLKNGEKGKASKDEKEDEDDKKSKEGKDGINEKENEDDKKSKEGKDGADEKEDEDDKKSREGKDGVDEKEDEDDKKSKERENGEDGIEVQTWWDTDRFQFIDYCKRHEIVRADGKAIEEFDCDADYIGQNGKNYKLTWRDGGAFGQDDYGAVTEMVLIEVNNALEKENNGEELETNDSEDKEVDDKAEELETNDAEDKGVDDKAEELETNDSEDKEVDDKAEELETNDAEDKGVDDKAEELETNDVEDKGVDDKAEELETNDAEDKEVDDKEEELEKNDAEDKEVDDKAEELETNNAEDKEVDDKEEELETNNAEESIDDGNKKERWYNKLWKGVKKLAVSFGTRILNLFKRLKEAYKRGKLTAKERQALKEAENDNEEAVNKLKDKPIVEKVEVNEQRALEAVAGATNSNQIEEKQI